MKNWFCFVSYVLMILLGNALWPDVLFQSFSIVGAEAMIGVALLGGLITTILFMHRATVFAGLLLLFQLAAYLYEIVVLSQIILLNGISIK